MRLALLAAGLGLLTAAPLHAQPIIIPLGPQPQRQPPPAPPPSPVPVAPAGRGAGAKPPVVYGGHPVRSPSSGSTAAGAPPGERPAIAAPSQERMR